MEPAPSEVLAPGTLVEGKYRVERLLGEGGMGEVYRAEHVGLGRDVALKVLHREVAANEAMTARFRQEARAAAAIRHRGIVEVFDVGVTGDGRPFIVMELLEGETLGGWMGRGPADPAAAVAIVAEVLEALAAAHERGIVHRDLKPENIYLVARPNKSAKILDFGISKFLDGRAGERLTRTGQVMGTPLYMAPEQARGARAVDAAADLYSIGAILYEALTGRPPHEGQTYVEIVSRVLGLPHQPACQVNPAVSPSLSRVIDWLLAKAPADRPAGAGAARAALQQSIREAPVPQKGATTVEEERAPVRDTIEESPPIGFPKTREDAPPAAVVQGAGTIDRPPRARLRILVGIAGVVAAGGLVAWLTHRSPSVTPSPVAPPPTAPVPIAAPSLVAPPPPAPAEIELELSAAPAAARWALDGKALGCNPCKVSAPLGSRRHATASAPGFADTGRTLTFDRPHREEVKLASQHAPRHRPVTPPAATSIDDGSIIHVDPQ